MKPNIIFILLDDLGCRDLGVFGSSFYETPNLDRLAEGGMRFTNAYASCCVCSPSRASIMSGKYPARLGLTHYIGGKDEGKLANAPYVPYLALEEKSIASTLRDNGYSTWHIGKWHLGTKEYYPEKHGFEVNVAGNHKGHPSNGYFCPYNLENLTEGFDGEYLTDRLTDEAVGLIKNRGDKPFFMHLSHYAVHTPIQAPEHLVAKYEEKAKRLKLDKVDPFVVGENFPCSHKRDQKISRRVIQSDAEYAAMMENLDANIGKVVDALESEGLLDNTMIVFTSDNGGLSTAEGSPTCNYPMSEGKGWGYEGGTRVCQFVYWQGKIRPGSVCHENVIGCDFYPTLLDVAGLAQMPQQHMDGMNMMPLLTEKSDKLAREAIYWHYPHYGNQGGTPHSSLVSGKWKLIEIFETGQVQLFDLDADISETFDVSGKNSELTAKLYGMLQKWQKDVGAVLPVPNPDYVE